MDFVLNPRCPSWTDDEKIAVRSVNNELHFFENNDFGKYLTVRYLLSGILTRYLYTSSGVHILWSTVYAEYFNIWSSSTIMVET